ncbi:MAG: GNAT family N-acetyltransferase [Thermoplasmata archaeon]|nr:GNAT family N-acetyltransferase [Thermoplasmata archaeon]
MSVRTPTLEGARVNLRAPEARDHEQMFSWYNDPEIVSPFDRFELDGFDDFLASLRATPDDPRSTAPRFVIEDRARHEMLGFVGHYEAHPVLAEVDIWYVMGRVASRGQGLGSEAVGLLVDHLLATGPAPRVGATSDVENVASTKLLERVGFRREGTIRSVLFHHGRWHDVFLYGITKAERPTPAP